MSGPNLGQAQKCGGIKPINGISALSLLIFVLELR
jgi:hypothetical protein